MTKVLNKSACSYDRLKYKSYKIIIIYHVKCCMYNFSVNLVSYVYIGMHTECVSTTPTMSREGLESILFVFVK